MNTIKDHPISVFAISAGLVVGSAKSIKGTPWYFHQLSNLELMKTLAERRTSPAAESYIKRKTILLKGITFFSNRSLLFLIGPVAFDVLSSKCVKPKIKILQG